MPIISREILWEMFKEYLKGMIISYFSGKNKAAKFKLDPILKDLQSLDSQYAVDQIKIYIKNAFVYKRNLIF